MSKTGLILAFYRDHAAANEALALLRQKGLRRSATLRRHPDGRFSQSRGVSSQAAVVLGGAIGTLLGRYLPLPRAANVALAPALGAVAGATAGYFGAQGADGGLPEVVLRRQRAWLLRGDTVLVAQAKGDRLGEIMDVLRDSSQPAVFVLRGGQQFQEEADEDALRGENLSSEQFREAARRLAARHRDAQAPHGSHSQSHRRLIQRLKANNRVIAGATQSLLEAARLDIPVSIAAEWLLDNGYIIEGQTKDALHNLSRQFYEELPVLPAQVAATLAHAGHLPQHDVPRVYALAVELVAQADSRLDKANIAEFVQAYQATTPLTMGELWALPLMLRVAIVENLRRLASRIARHQSDREQAALWANRLLNAAHHEPDSLPRLFADLAQNHPRPGAHFADRLVSNLFDEEAALLPARSWLESSLRVSLNEAQRDDQRRQAIDQVTVANCVTSLKHLGDMDWNKVFESLSLVESELRHDPTGLYAAMNFATRDRYRHEVEILARGSKQSEGEIARRVVALSGEADLDSPGEMRRHIGYYLIGDGRHEFEVGLAFQPRLRLQTHRFLQSHATPLYLGGIAAGTGSVLALGAYLGRRAGTRLSGPLLILGVLPASEIAVQIVNYLVTRTLPSVALPKMNFEAGVPDEWKTIVVVPTLLTSEDSIKDDIEQLEIHYLASGDRSLRFALLGDFADAPEAHMPNDGAILEAAQRGINELNARYPNGGDRFFLFNRGRIWSDSEERWMGTERKRGKLEELNRYLKGEWSGHPDESHPVAGDEARLTGIRFVITLDADTQMPHDTARRLIETLAHPLNRPQFSAEFGVRSAESQAHNSALRTPNSALVKRGYTLIQPRVTTTLPSATATRFARWFSDSMGRDPYTNVVSDVHQDLFREGSYHGKGIYDLDAFHAVLNNRFPPCTLLSHDLLEGAHVRVGYASDIEFLDDFPANYLTFAKRQHRWIRGDWQILDWIFNLVPTAQRGVRVANPLSTISRWKIADNLRRSVVPVGTTAFLIAGWLAGPSPAKVVTGLVLGSLFWPVIGQVLAWVTTNPTNPQKIKYLRQEAPTILPNVVRSAVWAALLPHQTVLALDAALRVLYRKFYSHKLMLEWETARVAGQSAAQREQAFLWRLGRGALFAGGVALLVRAVNPAGFVFAAPFLAPWAATPALVKWLSARWAAPPQEIAPADREYLRRIARQTWRYFDDFIGPHTHWLAPDNYQERLRVEIAQRTSPTNIGMWLLAVEAARDFGYITGDDAIGRLLSTLKSLETIEKHHGHLFNWYQVQTMQPLPPRYVSVVDSGNLLGCLWTLSEGIREQNDKPVLTHAALHGLADTLALLRASLDPESRAALLEDLAALDALVENDSTLPLIEIVRRLRVLQEPLARVAGAIHAQPSKAGGLRQLADMAAATSDPRFASSGSAYWVGKLAEQSDDWLHLADRYLTWVEVLADAPEEWLWPLGENSPALRRELLENAPSLAQLSSGKIEALNELLGHAREELPEATRLWLEKLQSEVERSRWLAGEMLSHAAELVDRTENMADEMDFGFLYDAERKLFPIGFNVEENRLDTSYYDLLASECRLASFMAVARGDVPAEHWLTLGRRFGLAPDGTPVLLSWSGTMFEYLMPLIFTESYENSLLDWACKQAVRQQMLYAKARHVPWGISEAAFSALDAQRTYQYKAFGVPALGLKRGLENDLVIAPYASLMALMIEPRAAIDNLRRLESFAMRGDYGFYESIDFKHQQLGDEDRGSAPSGKRGVVVHTYMVHHQGMALLALDNFLNDYALRRRFSSQPFARAALPLLYEKIPVVPQVLDESVREAPPKPVTSVVSPASTERLGTVNTPSPRVNLLSNGKMSVLTSNAGGGFARWNEFDLTRWRADTTRDQWGSFIYIRDLESTSTWSAAHQPIKRAAKWAHVHFRPEKTEFSRRDHDIETRLEIFVSPEDDAEIRLLHLTNHSANTRVLEVTSYSELSLAPHNADRAHPAFSKLFIQTEAMPERSALLAWRRLRSPHDTPIWAGCVLATAAAAGQFSYETDRLNFLGRNRTAENPQALESPLTNSAGAVLDPCFSLRQRMVLAPGQSVEMAFTLVAGSSREAVVALIEKFSDLTLARRALDLAWTHAQLEMHHLNLDTDLVGQFQHLASYLAYPFDALRAPAKRLRQNRKGQSGLWAYGVSGDLPIMVVTIGDERDMAVVRQAMQAHAFWRARGFATDLVILNEQASGYNQELSETLRKAAISFATHLPQEQIFDAPGGVFIRPADKIPEEDLSLLLAAARVVLVAARGPLSQQLGATPALPMLPPRLTYRQITEEPSAPLPFMELSYFNSLGGFTPDGREYAIYLAPGQQTPAPWVNVMASPHFGCVISESGRGFSWFGNSQSNRLTPWSNDAVSEGATEAIYIRDEESGVFWTPTALPIRENDAYRTRHGQGYSIFEHNSHAIEQELTVFVPLEGELGEHSPPVKIARLRLRNASSRRRCLRATQYADWVLGTTREEMQMHLTTAWDTEESILLAYNHYRPDFSERVGFASASPRVRSFSSDRTAFLGRNGSPSRPAAMERQHLDERCGAGFDACAAVQVLIDLEPGESTDVIFLLGEAADVDEARHLVRRFRDPRAVEAALQATKNWWDEFLGALRVDVPDPSVNFLLNRWLPYQTLSCRVWGRSAWYQSGGAFGFRDQLQDVMSLQHAKPQLARAQILNAAAHQFEEGDVQHWWHPPSDAGVRTRFADDLLWLPYTVAQYIEVTGDAAILDEVAPFLHGEPLKDDEHEVYNRPQISPESATIFEHCRRAIDKGCTHGPHDLPLIGTGDWNDGLNRVGVEGKGESVWMGWFLCDVLNRFAGLCQSRGEAKLAADYQQRATDYVAAIEEHAWDGEWYLRAFFDDGSPMGSQTCEEAKIDSLPQSWAVISGAGDEKRIAPALKAAEAHLVKPDDDMILLFTPAFDQTEQDPGYIKGYLPGVRENGGQYTHAATWLALAFAERGEGDKAVQLLRMLNPVEHAREPEDVWRYKVEPYVVVADVYALEGKVGRGGWTWYTGSASWLYRVWVEAVLGFKLHGDELEISPVLPHDWREFAMTYQRGGTTHQIHVANPDGVSSGVATIELNGVILPSNRIPLADDGQTHEMRVQMGIIRTPSPALPLETA